MNIKNVNILLTFECNAQCRHCSYQAGPHRHGHVLSDQACLWLEQLYRINPLDSVTIHGGEPFLYFNEMCAINAKARELNIDQRWVITNGFWADDRKEALERLRVLKDAGLTAITFSVDAFHQVFVPFETVRQGIECSIQTGLATYVDSYFLPSCDQEHECNVRTRNYMEDLAAITGPVFKEYYLSFEGRASLLAAQYPGRKIPWGKCRFPFWLGGNLENPETVEIDCEGNVTLCPGLCIGNIKRSNLAEIINGYEFSTHPVISVLAQHGPIGLYNLAKSFGYMGDRGFADECHLCYEMRKFLVTRYPEYLAPVECYQDR